MGTNHHVFEDGKAFPQCQVLEGSICTYLTNLVRLQSQKILTLKFNRTFGRVINAAHDVEQRRLTGPIGTDQTTDLAFLDIERCRVESGNSPELHRDVPNRQLRHEICTPPSKASGLGRPEAFRKIIDKTNLQKEIIGGNCHIVTQ